MTTHWLNNNVLLKWVIMYLIILLFKLIIIHFHDLFSHLDIRISPKFVYSMCPNKTLIAIAFFVNSDAGIFQSPVILSIVIF